MNADLTFNSIAFKRSFDEKDGSVRQSTARGINIPDSLVIKTQDYIDSATKVAGRRYTARVDRATVDANGINITTSCYFVFALPKTAVTGDVTAVLATFRAAVADTDFMGQVLNNEK